MKRRPLDKSFSIAFGIVLLILMIPITLVFLQQQQTIKQQAATLSIKHIIIIPFENNQLSLWMADPYFASLAKKYGSATNFHGFSGTSLPDYLMETSGSNQRTTSDNFTPCQYNVPNIYDVLKTNGLTYENYEESGNQDNHRHTPAYFYPSTCKNIQDMSVFMSKYINGNAIPPSYVWVTPNFTDDAHDSDVATASKWLQNTFKLDTLLSKTWFLDGSTLVILVCDDGGSSSVNTMDIMISTSSLGKTSNTNYTHPNNLSTVMWLLGISGSIGDSNASSAMKDLFSTISAPSPTPSIYCLGSCSMVAPSSVPTTVAPPIVTSTAPKPSDNGNMSLIGQLFQLILQLLTFFEQLLSGYKP